MTPQQANDIIAKVLGWEPQWSIDNCHWRAPGHYGYGPLPDFTGDATRLADCFEAADRKFGKQWAIYRGESGFRFVPSLGIEATDKMLPMAIALACYEKQSRTSRE